MLQLLRLVVIVQCGFLVVATTVIVLRYARQTKTSPSRHQRILAWHIVLIGISYIGAVTAEGVDMISFYDYPTWTWRLPLGLFVFTCGNLGLCLVVWRLTLMRKLDKQLQKILLTEKQTACKDAP